MLQASHKKRCKDHENLAMLEGNIYKGTWLGSFAICTATGLQGFQVNHSESLIFHAISSAPSCVDVPSLDTCEAKIGGLQRAQAQPESPAV